MLNASILQYLNQKKPNKIISTSDYEPVIEGFYTYDYNILEVDRKIINKLKSENIDDLKKEKKKLDHLVRNSTITVLKQKEYLDRIKFLDEEIDSITTGKKIEQYRKKTKLYLDEYRKLRHRITIEFGKESENDIDDKESQRRISIIQQYLEIAKEYLQVNVTYHAAGSNQNICSNCNNILEKGTIDEYGIQYCQSCGAEHITFVYPKKLVDNMFTGISTNDDESIENFMRAFDDYQGIQLNPPPESLDDELDRYFRSKGKPIGAEIRKLPLNERGRRGDTNREMLQDVLSKIGASEYYNAINYLGKRYWGWKLPDVSQLRDIIRNDYIETQQIYHSIPIDVRERYSSLGTQFRLYQHLRLRGHECYPDEFKMADNPESLENHRRLWKMMCDGCSNPDIYYIED